MRVNVIPEILTRCLMPAFTILLTGFSVSIREPVTAQEFTIYQEGEISCAAPPPEGVVIAVQTSSGLFAFEDYCQIAAEMNEQVLQRQDSLPWDSIYQQDEVVCRNRSSRGETVCFSLQAAENLRW